MSERIAAAAKVMMKEYLEAEDNPNIATLNEAFEQVARSMDNEGLLAPELPTANDPTISAIPDGKGWLIEDLNVDPAGPVVWTVPGGHIMIQRIEPGQLAPEDARKFALNILAAADYSEKEEQQ